MNNNNTGDPRYLVNAINPSPYYTTVQTGVTLGGEQEEIVVVRNGKKYNIVDMIVSNERKMRSVCKIMRENKLCEKCDLKMECLFE